MRFLIEPTVETVVEADNIRDAMFKVEKIEEPIKDNHNTDDVCIHKTKKQYAVDLGWKGVIE